MAKSSYTQREQDQIIADVFDPNLVVLTCAKHGYVGDGKGQDPQPGCHECHMAYWVQTIAKIPAHKREEFLEMLMEAGKDMVQAEREGKVLPQVYRHPIVEFEKN